MPGQVHAQDNPALLVQPDPLAPAPLTTYMFGFLDVTGLASDQIKALKGKAQYTSPPIVIDENDDLRLTLYNLGLQQRPDITDSHSIHWHGFRNAIPAFDGVPDLSVSVPIGSGYTYVFRPPAGDGPGTYMYHCHFEDVEHVSQGMTGLAVIRPAQNGTPFTYQGRTLTRFAYNDGDGSTGYDRDFGFMMHEIFSELRFNDAHIQLTDWTTYRPDYYTLNGRVYPYTIAPHGMGRDPLTGDLIITPGYEHLQYQPISSLVRANAGEQVLLRFANLGYQHQVMTLPGIPMRVVGKDAAQLRGRDGANQKYVSESITLGPGESVDAIFTAPNVTPGPNGYATYLLYNRKLASLSNAGGPGYGGQMTEVRIFPPDTLPPQTQMNL
jgi:FtsP/CotA-like multicopper oxidase with cupredoxin domain